MRTQTEMTTFSCREDCKLTKNTQRWTYSALQYFFSVTANAAMRHVLIFSVIPPHLSLITHHTQLYGHGAATVHSVGGGLRDSM